VVSVLCIRYSFQMGFLYTGLLSIIQQYTCESVMLKAPEVAK
jgi:hypothetical protein